MEKLIFILLMILPSLGFCQKGDFVIKGKLVDVNTPAKVYLINSENESVVDSTTILKGGFTLEGHVEMTTPALLVLNKENTGYKLSNDGKALYLETGTIRVNSDSEFLYLAKVSGTPTNDESILFNQIRELADPFDEKISRKKNTATPEQLRSESFLEEITFLENEKLEIINKAINDFIKDNPNSLISILGLFELSDFEEYAVLSKLYNSLTPRVQNSFNGKLFAEQLAVLKRVRVGALAPDLTLPDTSGNPIQLSSFRGKYVLMDIWAAWCGPCRKENPNLVRTYTAFKDEKFTVLGVSLDDERDQWINAIHRDGLPWTQVSDLKLWESQVVKLFGVNSIPQNYLIDPSGVIIARNLQGQDLRNRLAEIFGKD